MPTPYVVKSPSTLAQVEVGPMIREARERVGITQADVADALGVSSALVSQMETGVRTVASRHIDSLAAVLDLDDSEVQALRTAAFTPGVKLSDLASDLAEVRRGVDEIRAYLGIDDDSE